MAKKWVQRRPNCNTVEDVIKANTGIPLSEFLYPKSDPYLVNLRIAVELVKQEIAKGKKITIIGDYDCDGIIASTILHMAVTEFSGTEPKVRIPRRFSEGYGLSMKIIDEISEGLIITVDNGIAALKQIEAAKEKGLTVIVIDHHLPVTEEKRIILPKADVILDPMAIPGSEFDNYCGAGLAYRFAKELLPGNALLESMLAMASVATVADVMPLVGDNRNLVQKGLECVRNRRVTLGFNTLLDELGLTYVTEGDYGYKLGPVVNAAGRLSDDGPMDVFRVLKTHVSPIDPEYTKTLIRLQDQVKKLVENNTDRQEMVRSSMILAKQQIEEKGLWKKKPMILYDNRFSEGIIGIIAGKITEQYCCPALVFTDAGTPGILKGSGRTYGTVHLKHLLDKASDILVGYGGHAGAAGMSVRSLDLDALQKRLSKKLEGVDMGVDPDTIYYDVAITTKEIPVLIKKLAMYAPFGEGNPSLVFRVNDFECCPVAGKFIKRMGNYDQHVKFFGKEVSAVGFDMYDRYQESGEPHHMDFIGVLSQNFFNGKFYDQIEVTDFHPVAKKQTDARKALEDFLIFT